MAFSYVRTKIWVDSHHFGGIFYLHFLPKNAGKWFLQNAGSRVQLKCDGTRWRTGGEVKGKLANGVGSQYHSLPWNLVYPALVPLMCTPWLPVVDWTDAPADLNGLGRFAERRNLVSACVPSHFKRSLPVYQITHMA